MSATEANPEIGQMIEAGGIATNYIIDGSGPPIILIHGSGPGVTGYANWRAVLPRLAPCYTAIAPDVVGFGYTERPKGFSYTLDNWVGHITAFMDALGIEKAHFVGNSFGGAISLALAARHPDRVDKFVLMGAAGLPFPITPGLEAVWGYSPSLDAMAELMGYFAHNPALASPEIVESRYRASIRPGYQEAFAAMFSASRQAKLDALATPEDAIRDIRSEALIIHGREDRVVPYEVSLQMHRLMPKSQLHLFGECGHWTQVEKTAEFCGLLLNFFSAGQSL